MATALTLTACSLLVGATLVVRSATLRARLMLATLVVSPLVLAVHVADAAQLTALRERPALAGAAIVVAIAAKCSGWIPGASKTASWTARSR